MSRRLLPLALSGLLMLGACGEKPVEVFNSNGKVIGTIEIQGTHTATLLNVRGDVRGKVRGSVVRDESGKNIGTITEKDGHILLSDAADNEIGTVEGGTDCYGKSNAKLGTVTGETDSYAVAAACIVFFLQ